MQHRAMVIKNFGGFGVFEKMNLTKPIVKHGHVLIKVEATSVNPLDTKLRKGEMPDLVSGFPMVLHGDVAGTVMEVGEGVQFKVGDEVYGCAGGVLAMQGALAEYMLADAHLLALKPKSLSFLQAAALPLVSITAWEGLVTKAHLQMGQSVLIHGGTGGVGHIAVQIANWIRANVSATASSPEKCDIAKRLGANNVINYRTTTAEKYIAEFTKNEGFDVVFDTVGGDHLQDSVQAAAIGGQVISILSGGNVDTSAAFLKGLTLHFVLQPLPLITGRHRAHYGDILAKIAELVDTGWIKPLIDKHCFDTNDVKEAHALVENHAAIGKVVLRSRL